MIILMISHIFTFIFIPRTILLRYGCSECHWRLIPRCNMGELAQWRWCWLVSHEFYFILWNFIPCLPCFIFLIYFLLFNSIFFFIAGIKDAQSSISVQGSVVLYLLQFTEIMEIATILDLE